MAPPVEPSFVSTIVPVLPLKEMIVFPNSINPLFVMRPRSLAALDAALGGDKRLFLTGQKDMDVDMPGPGDLYRVGTVCEVLQVLRVPDGSAKVLVQGEYVARAVDFSNADGYLQALVAKTTTEPMKGPRAQAMRRILLGHLETYARLSEKLPEDLLASIQRIEDPLGLAYAIANYASIKIEAKQQIIECNSTEDKLVLLQAALTEENQILELENKIASQVKTQIGRTQKEYFLNEQLKAIERELGIEGEEDQDFRELRNAIEASGMPAEAREKAEKELRRLTRMPPLSPEATVSRTYIEWLTEIPWIKETLEEIDMAKARGILDRDHYGLEKIKDRILEFLAVVKLTKQPQGSILCFVGPPGVGKTSLARSIAGCMRRNFVRVSLGGVRDEAEIRGHRRTYVGALPGKVAQSMKKAGTINPVFLLDEVDKMSSDFRGDPTAALLEVLDPEQNRTFNDHYLEVDYDLSKVLFIATANTTDGIPPALLDRMEVIRLAGYTEAEKRMIAKRYLIPRQTKNCGLKRSQVRIEPGALSLLISGYTKEAGVRNLEREIGSVCRKIARSIVESTTKAAAHPPVTAELLREMLGPVRFSDQQLQGAPELGVALGLAWTDVGGELLPVETSLSPGKGGLLLTGKLGEVMQESAKTALSFLRAHAVHFGIPAGFHAETDIHIHVPEGAIPKDGPSAGITMAASLASALSHRPVRQDIAMTGEVTLRGRVLKIGGLKEKVLAAHRHHIRTVILPRDNEEEIPEIPVEVRRVMRFVPVSTLKEALELVLVGEDEARKHVPPRPQRAVAKARRQVQAT